MNTVVRRIGDSDGVILPKDVLEQAGFATGDHLEAIGSEDGIRLVKVMSTFEKEMSIAREAMEKHRGALAKLAES